MRLLLSIFLLFSMTNVFADVLAPTISHVPPLRQTEDRPIVLNAEVEDNYAVATVDLYIAVDDGLFRKVEMNYMHGNHYEWTMTERPKSRIRYYIEAMDTAGNVVSSGSQILPYEVEVTPSALASGEREVKTDKAAKTESESVAPFRESEKPKKSWLKWAGIVGAAVLIGAVAGASGGGGGNDPGPTAANDPQPQPTPGPAPQPGSGGIRIGGVGLQ